MKRQSFDVLVPKEYETMVDGRPVKKKAWNKVGRAWKSLSDRSMSFELYLIPGQQYVISLREREQVVPETAPSADFQNFDQVPF